MGVPVTVSPLALNFGGVAPNSTGPDLSQTDPDILNLSAGVVIANAPSDARVTVVLTGDTMHFAIASLDAYAWVTRPLDPGEWPPGHHGPPPMVRVLELVEHSDGASSLPVRAGQLVSVIAGFRAPGGDGIFTGLLKIQGSSWDPVQIPLSFFVTSVSTTIRQPTPVSLPQGVLVNIPIEVRVVVGPDVDVTYELSRTLLHTGVTVLPMPAIRATRAPQQRTLPLQVAIDAPLGENSLWIDQFAFNLTSLLLPVIIGPDPQPDLARRAIAAKAAERANVLGQPVSPIFSPSRPDGLAIFDSFLQHFESGDIYYSPAIGAHEVHGQIRLKYDFLGGPGGLLGFPVTDETIAFDGFGRFNDFENGSIFWHPQIGPRMVRDTLRVLWTSQGREQSSLGYPVRDEHRLHPSEHLDDPDPNIPILWSTFQNGALVQTEHGLATPLVARVTPDKLKVFVRKQFADVMATLPDNVGLHPEIDIVSVLEWDHDVVESTGRAIVFRLRGFHDNGLLQDTEFVFDIGLRLGWKVPTSDELHPDPASRTLSAALVPGSLVVQAFGFGAHEVQSGLTAAIERQFATPLRLKDVPVVAGNFGKHFWAVVDLIVKSDGELQILVFPSPFQFIPGGATVGEIVRDTVQQQLDAFISPSN